MFIIQGKAKKKSEELMFQGKCFSITGVKGSTKGRKCFSYVRNMQKYSKSVISRKKKNQFCLEKCLQNHLLTKFNLLGLENAGEGMI